MSKILIGTGALALLAIAGSTFQRLMPQLKTLKGRTDKPDKTFCIALGKKNAKN